MKATNCLLYTSVVLFLFAISTYAQEDQKLNHVGENSKTVVIERMSLRNVGSKADLRPSEALDNTIDVAMQAGETVEEAGVYLGAGRLEPYFFDDTNHKPSFLSYKTNSVYRRYSNLNPIGSMYVDFTLSADGDAPNGDRTFEVDFTFHTGESEVKTYTLTINVLIADEEIVSTPDEFTCPDSGKVAQSLSFSADGASSIFNHDVEYQFDWGDGTRSDWSWSGNESHSFDDSGTKKVKVRARCESHTDIRSDWSEKKSVEITYCTLTIIINPEATGSVSKDPDKADFSYNESVSLTAIAYSGYEFKEWSGDLSGTSRTKSLTLRSDKNITANFQEVLAPVAAFGASQVSGNAPLTVLFFDQSKGSITDRLWDFGDRDTSTVANPSHTYPNAGIYTVKLKVTGPGGSDSKTINDFINVFDSQTSFTDIGANIKALRSGSTQWGDYDCDDDLDLLMTGRDKAGKYFSKIYENHNNTFIDANAVLPPVAYGNTCWGDYDNDGDLDILLCGWDGRNDLLGIYQNNDGEFSKVNSGLTALGYQEAAWADADNDGDLDVLVTGLKNSTPKSILYVNIGKNTFTYKDLNLSTNVYDGSITWGDYDNDGDKDLVLTGRRSSSLHTTVYRNDGNYQFTDIQANLQGVYLWSCVEFGDYDNDGDLDLVLTGAGSLSDTGRYTLLYQNVGNDSFETVDAGLKASKQGSIMWGDYDNDGDLDIFLSGFDGYNDHTKLYKNNGNDNFTLLPDDFPDAVGGCAWGDYDTDGDLDLAIAGWNGNAELYFGAIYKNNTETTNTKPEAPSNIQSSFWDGELTMSWEAASDAETPDQSLGYNLRIGITPGGNEILSACASADGRRMLCEPGNLQMNTTWTVNNLPDSVLYYWAVQAIDGCFAGSEWAEAEIATSVEDKKSIVPDQFALFQNYPNPFNPGTVISYHLPVSAVVELAIFSINGQKLATLVSERQPAGAHKYDWDASQFASGVYFYRLTSDDFVLTKKLALLK